MKIKIGLGILIFSIVAIVLHFSISSIEVNPDNQGFWFNIVALFLLLAISGVVICLLAKKRNWKTIVYVAALLVLSFVIRVLFSDFQSGDYKEFLSIWIDEYRNSSIADSLKSETSNYLPIYNYFLILFSRIPVYDLYLIKLLSFVFEILSAFAIVIIISRLTKKQINPILFAAILLLPVFFMDSTVWAQCDSIYTFFGLIGFYFAISKKFLRAFLFFGISFAIKLQSILIFPIIFVLLFMKSNNGNKLPPPMKFIPIAIIPFFVLNFWGVFAGADPLHIFSIYLEQSGSVMSVFSHFTNFPYFFNSFFAPSTKWLYYIGNVTFMLLTAGWLFGVVWFAVKKARQGELSVKSILFITYYILLGTMFLMPKMHERFIYFTLLVGIIYLAMVFREKDFQIHLLAYLGIFLSTILMFVSYLFTDISNKICQIYFNSFSFGALIMLAVFIYFSYLFYKEYLQKNPQKQEPKSLEDNTVVS